jgi:hypothetical protein
MNLRHAATAALLLLLHRWPVAVAAATTRECAPRRPQVSAAPTPLQPCVLGYFSVGSLTRELDFDLVGQRRNTDNILRDARNIG